MEYVSAGESHGPALCAIVSGVPAGIALELNDINYDLARRQRGYGRGGRMGIEQDTAQVLSGVRFGKTLGSPVTLQIKNDDFPAWTGRMDVFGTAPEKLVREVTPRPGHADLVGTLKTDTDDCRNILERASARETAARVAAGALAKAFLKAVGVEISSYVTRIGDVSFAAREVCYDDVAIEESLVRCPDAKASEAMCQAIDAARAAGDSLGGWFRVVVCGLVPGVGGYATPGERLTSRLGGALFSIPAIKGVEFGLGMQAGCLPGSKVHDEIVLTTEGDFSRKTNNAGGLEGGMTTGEPLVIRACMKPIPTLTSPLQTVNLDTREVTFASKERSDVCAVPAAAVVAEAEVALVLANAYQEKFGHDDMNDILQSLSAYITRIS